MIVYLFNFFLYSYGEHRDLYVLTHSFPTRRSSELQVHFKPFTLWGRGKKGLKSLVHDKKSKLVFSSIFRPSPKGRNRGKLDRSDEHTSELQSLMRISYAVFCLKKKTKYAKENKVAICKYHTSFVTNIYVPLI